MYQPLPPHWDQADQAARDRAFSNAKSIPDSPAIIEERNVASAAFRSARPDKLNLPYGSGERCAWDLYPGSEPGAPCLVFIHGGYWQNGRREDYAVFAEGALALGWSAALPGYTLAPKASLGEIVREIHSALDWLAKSGKAHGIAGKIVLSGWSAGGHLVAMSVDHPAVSAGLAISGIFELAPIRDTYLNAALKLTDTEIASLSPLRLPPSGKPVSIAYGSAELPQLRRQSRAWHEYRSEAHCPGPLIPVARSDHFRILNTLRKPDGALVRAAEELLR
jgi:acetyl esterase/lipase